MSIETTTSAAIISLSDDSFALLKTKDDLRALTKKPEVIDYVKRTYKNIDVKDALEKLVDCGKLLQVALTAAGDQPCNVPILEILSKYQNFVHECTTTSDKFINASFKSLKVFKGIFDEIIETGDDDELLDIGPDLILDLSTCFKIAEEMARTANEAAEKSGTLTNLAENALIQARKDSNANTEKNKQIQQQVDEMKAEQAETEKMLEKFASNLKELEADRERARSNLSEARDREYTLQMVSTVGNIVNQFASNAAQVYAASNPETAAMKTAANMSATVLNQGAASQEKNPQSGMDTSSPSTASTVGNIVNQFASNAAQVYAASNPETAAMKTAANMSATVLNQGAASQEKNPQSGMDTSSPSTASSKLAKESKSVSQSSSATDPEIYLGTQKELLEQARSASTKDTVAGKAKIEKLEENVIAAEDQLKTLNKKPNARSNEESGKSSIVLLEEKETELTKMVYEMKDREAKAAAAQQKYIARLSSMDVELTDLEQTVFLLQFTMQIMGQIKTVFLNVKTIWEMLGSQALSVAEGKELDLDYVEKLTDANVKSSRKKRFRKKLIVNIQEYAVIWTGLGRISYNAFDTITNAKMVTDGVMNKLPRGKASKEKVEELIQSLDTRLQLAIQLDE